MAGQLSLLVEHIMSHQTPKVKSNNIYQLADAAANNPMQASGYA
jgi:hypothetical protein